MGASISSFSIIFDYEEDPQHRSSGNGQISVASGSSVSGRVVLRVKRTCKLEEDLVFEALGKEEARSHRSSSSKNSPSNGENVIISVRDVLSTRNTRLTAGDQAFPFAIQLPASAPASMTYGKSNYGCTVQYRVKASMGLKHVAEKVFQVATPNISSMAVPRLIAPTTATVRKLGGVLQLGSITYGVSISDTTVGRGQVVQIGVACRNNSTADIKVQVKLIELVNWTVSNDDSHLSETEKVTLAHWECSNLPCLAKQEKSLVRQILRNRTAFHEVNETDVQQELERGRYKIPVTIPQRSRVSSQGTLVTVSHYIKVKFLTQSLLAGNPDLKIPIVVGNRQNTSTAFGIRASGTQSVAYARSSSTVSTHSSTHVADPHAPVSTSSLPSGPPPVQDEIPLVTAQIIPDDSNPASEPFDEDPATKIIVLDNTNANVVAPEPSAPVEDVSEHHSLYASTVY